MVVIAPAVAIAAISGAAQLGSGIASASNARSNAAAQRDAADAQARAQNEYNKKSFEAQKANYEAMREYNYQTAMKQYEYNTAVQNLQYDNQVRAYNQSQQNLSNQLEFNEIGVRSAYIREQNVMKAIADEQAFGRQEEYIAALKAKGTAAASAGAGASGDRAVTMALAEKGRQLAIMDASYNGALTNHSLNMFDIALNKIGSDMNAKGSAMLTPSKPIPLVRPERTPEMQFVEPMQAMPGYVPSPNTLGTILGSAAGAIGGIAGAMTPNPTASTPAPSAGSFNTSGLTFNPQAFSMPQLAGGG